MNKASQLPTVAVTMGDPAGIGPELCLHALAHESVLKSCNPLVFGDVEILQEVAGRCGLTFQAAVISWEEFRRGALVKAPAVVNCAAIKAAVVQPGRLSAACGQAAFRYIELAIEAALQRRFGAIATAPINKEALQAAAIPFPGHTEIFGALTKSPRVCMMLASDDLTVSMVTTHIGYSEVPSRLSEKRILDVIELTCDALKRRLGRAVRLAVCGLNPHAGENGLFGDREEERLIQPAIDRAREKGLSVVGPWPPDSAFVPARRAQVDAVVCMYHDQGHIPFKMLAFDQGVNVTLGLPIVRTSVDHGTAFDIAWQGRANPESMVQAVLWAARLADQRS